MVYFWGSCVWNENKNGRKKRIQKQLQHRDIAMICEMHFILGLPFTMSVYLICRFCGRHAYTYFNALSFESITKKTFQPYHFNRLIVCFIYSTFSSGIPNGCLVFFLYLSTYRFFVKKVHSQPFCVQIIVAL